VISERKRDPRCKRKSGAPGGTAKFRSHADSRNDARRAGLTARVPSLGVRTASADTAQDQALREGRADQFFGSIGTPSRTDTVKRGSPATSTMTTARRPTGCTSGSSRWMGQASRSGASPISLGEFLIFDTAVRGSGRERGWALAMSSRDSLRHAAALLGWLGPGSVVLLAVVFVGYLALKPVRRPFPEVNLR